MSGIKWIKISTEIFDNRKIKQIEALPEGDALIVIWIKLLCLAGNINDMGYVYLTKEVPYTEEMLATQFDRPLPTIKLALTTFERYGMIEVIDNILCISNWEKYQNVDRMTEIREYNRIAKQKSRAKQKLLKQNVLDTSMTSQCGHDTDIDIDIDKDKEHIDNACEELSPDLIFEKFWEVYPKKIEYTGTMRAFGMALLQDVNLTPEMLLASATNYAEAVKIEKREERYIKSPSRFISDSTFIDYLPDNYKKPKPKPSSNKFTNFKQNEYDYDALEEELLSYQ